MNWTATVSANPRPCKRCSKPTPATPLNAWTWRISLIIYGKKTNLERNGKRTAYGRRLMDRKIGFGVNGTLPQIAGGRADKTSLENMEKNCASKVHAFATVAMCRKRWCNIIYSSKKNILPRIRGLHSVNALCAILYFVQFSFLNFL